VAPLLKYDEIGYWSEIKLDIIKEYAQAYSKIMNTQRFIRKHIYIDAFAGAGHHISKVTERLPAGQNQRMDKAWGDHSWRLIAYETVPTLFGDSEMKTSNETVAEAFRQRLQAVAGFKFVPSPIPMRNNQGATIYYLYFASASQTGAKIVSSIFKKYQDRGRIK
jgi:hypothetical protein